MTGGYVPGVAGLDPTAIRKSLQQSRQQRIPFPQAWDTALDGQTVQPLWDDVEFMRKQFEAAYSDDASKRGRCMIPERDVSRALVLVRELQPARDHERCRSADGCDREAVRGRFGRMWCEHHGAELERLSEKLSLDIAKADPRNGGNTSLYTHKAA